MLQSFALALLGASIPMVTATPLLAVGQPSVAGVATFNNYTAQGGSVCIPAGQPQRPGMFVK